LPLPLELQLETIQTMDFYPRNDFSLIIESGKAVGAEIL
jgi:hypothetical protein